MRPSKPDLPTWEDVKVNYPDLAQRLAENQHDYDALVQWTALALGASIIVGQDETKD